jgi:DNA polymerase III delta prime subunit
LTFDEWKEKYFKENILKDEIISIVEYTGEFEVYDLSLDIIHSYITNGFISHNCNNINKVVEPIQSRCQIINFSYPKKEEILEYMEYICKEENIEYNKEGLLKLIDINYPSIRNCVISLQDLFVQKLPINIDTVQPANYIFNIYWEKLKQGDWKGIKQSLMESSVDARDLNEFFWQKALQEENIKIIQLTCRNEKDIAVGANPVIVVTSSLIELAK